MTNKRSGWMLAAGSAAVLPGLVILSIIGVIVLGGIADGMPKNAAVKELLSWLQTLPVLTGNAVAAVIVAMFVLWAFAYEPGPAAEKHWFDLALAGDRHAKWMIVQHNIHRLLMLAMFLYFFLPQR
jgi:hypothetical protein